MNSVLSLWLRTRRFCATLLVLVLVQTLFLPMAANAARSIVNFPDPQGLSVDGKTLTLAYNATLNTSSVPPVSDFAVMSDGNAVSLTTVAVGTSAVTLTLATTVVSGQAVYLTYTPDAVSPITAQTGTQANALNSARVYNATAPVFSAAEVNGASLALSYASPLDATSTPAGTDFTVNAGAGQVNVSNVTVADATVTLTLSTAVYSGQAVTVSYTPGDTPIADDMGNPVAALNNQAVTNNTPALTLQSAAVNGATLTLTYNATLASSQDLAGSNFEVDVNDDTPYPYVDDVNSVAVAGNTVTLTLAYPIGHIETVALTYMDPDGANPLQDGGGNPVQTFSNQSVTNNTPLADATPPTVTSAAVNGSTLTLTYSERLYRSAIPDPSYFSLGGTTAQVFGVNVNPDSTVTLLLDSPVVYGEAVSLSYTNPMDASSLVDLDGLAAADLYDQPVTNSTPQLAQLTNAEVNGSALTLTFDQNLNTTPPSGSDFVVNVVSDGNAVYNFDIDAVVVNGNQVALTLHEPVGSLEAVQVSYVGSDLRDLAGNLVPGVDSFDVANSTSQADATPPTLTSAVANDTSITLTFSERLFWAPPLAAAFTVKVGGTTTDNVLDAQLTGANTVRLRLADPVHSGQAVTVTYTAPTDPGAVPVEDPDGNLLSDITTPYTVQTPPVFNFAQVGGTTLELYYDGNLDATFTPAPTDFAVSVGPFPLSVSSVAVADNKVTLTLTPPVHAGDPVYVGYTPGVRPIQVPAGYKAAPLINQAVSNVTSDAAPALQVASLNDTTLALSYDQPLQISPTPTIANFSVTWTCLSGIEGYSCSGGGNLPVTNVAVFSADGEVHLTLADRLGPLASVTVSYNPAPGSNQIQSLSGVPAAVLTDAAVFNNNRADATAPTLTAASVSGKTLTLSYSELLSPGWVPDAAAFSIGKTMPQVRSVAVTGATVTLTLDTAVNPGDQVTVTYDPSDEPYPLEDTDGTLAAGVTDQAVTNNTVEPAKLQAAAVYGTTLTLTYSGTLANSTPAATDFAVTAGGTPVTVSGVAVAGQTVTLTLSAPVAAGNIVLLSYTPGASPIKDQSGTLAAALDGQVVTNQAPAPAGTLYVGPGLPYATLADALAAAQDGNTIIMAAGTHAISGSLTINTPNLTVRSQSGATATTVQVGAEADLVINAVGVTIADLHFVESPGNTNTPIQVNAAAAGVTLSGNVIEGSGRERYGAVFVLPNFTGALTFRNNQIKNATVGFFVATVTNATVTIADNQITGTQGNSAIQINQIGLATPDTNEVQITGNTLGAPDGSDDASLGDGVGVNLLSIDWNSHVVVDGNHMNYDGAGVNVAEIGTNANGHYGQPGYTAPVVEVRNNTFNETAWCVTKGGDWANGAQVIISSNTIRNGPGGGIDMELGFSAVDLRISDNTISGFTDYEGIILDWASIDAATTIAITGNHVTGGAVDGVDILNDPDSSNESPNISFVGNTITDNAGAGLNIGPIANHLTVAGNQFADNGQADIVLNGQANQIYGNTFAVAGKATGGIAVGSTATDNQIQYNQFLGGGVGIVNSGAPTVNATLNWWGDASGPGASRATHVAGDVTASPWLTGITWTPNSLSLAVGASQLSQPAFTTLAADTTTGSQPVDLSKFSLSSSAPAVATVAANGTVTAVGVGTATISTGFAFDPGLPVTVPYVTIHVAAATTYESTVTVTGTANPGAAVTVGSTTATADQDGNWSASVSLVMGTNTITATNGTATAQVTVVRQQQPAPAPDPAPAPAPAPVSYVTISAAVTATREATATVSGTANPGASVSVGGTTVTASSAGSWTAVVSLHEGANTITATNGSASGTVTVTRDSTPPAVTLTAAETETFADHVTLSATTEADATFTIAGQAVGTGSGTLTVDLEVGSNTFTATATDKLGNEGTATVTVVRKAQPATDAVVDPAEPATVTGDDWTVNIPAGSTDQSFRVAVAAPSDTQAVDQVKDAAAVASAAEVDAQDQSTSAAVHTFKKKLTVTFHYDATQFPDPSILAIYWHDPATGAWVNIGGQVDSVAHTITAEVDHFTLFAVLAPHDVAPTLDSLPATTAAPSLTVTGRATAGSTVTLVLDGHAAATGAADASGAYNLTAALQEGRNLLYVKGTGVLASSEAVVTFIAPVPAPPAPTPVPGPVPTPTQPVAVHLIDISGHWAETAIERLVGQGIVSGFDDQTFRPDLTINRLQFTVLLARTLGLKGGTDLSSFTDAVSIPEWARADVAAAVAAGLVHGRDDGSFDPGAKITRAEAAVMLARALQSKGISATGNAPALTDFATVPDWAKASVQAAVDGHIITGYADGSFQSGNLTTRAEVAVMLNRLLDAR